MTLPLAASVAADDLLAEFLAVLASRFARAVARHKPSFPAPPTAGRRWKKLASTTTYDVWLIEWSPGSGLPEHDHGVSSAAFCVVAGSLENRAEHDRARVVPSGGVTTVPARQWHAVRNADATTAVSVHVYSPPLGDDWRP